MNIQLRWFLLLGGVMFHLQGVAAGSGVTPEKIHLGSVLALKGKAQGLGQSMRYGLNAALNGQQVGKRTVEDITIVMIVTSPQKRFQRFKN